MHTIYEVYFEMGQNPVYLWRLNLTKWPTTSVPETGFNTEATKASIIGFKLGGLTPK